MPRKKQFVKAGYSKRKNVATSLDDADDYQAAGVEYEEAGGKHRAGDAAKSMRFFQKAIDTYEEGLRRFPQSFDLAYNKARLQFEIATHPALVKQLPAPLVSLLEVALTSHNYALNLDKADAELLFNAAQVLTNIAEEYANSSQHLYEKAVTLLHDALEYQAQCLSIQECKHLESQAQQQEADDMRSEQVMHYTPEVLHDELRPRTPVTEERWASVVEPITVETLVDTILAQISTMTTLASVLSSIPDNNRAASDVSRIEEHASILLNKLNSYTIYSEAVNHQVALAKAILSSAILDAKFHRDLIGVNAYNTSLTTAFDSNDVALALEKSLDALLAHTTSLITCNFSLTGKLDYASDPVEWNDMRWRILGVAFKSLNKAEKLPAISPEDFARTHFLRGDLSMLQFQLSKPPYPVKTAIDQSQLLIKNAKTYYRNVIKLAKDADEKDVAGYRYSIASLIENVDPTEQTDREIAAFGCRLKERSTEWVDGQAEEMVAEGLM